MPIVGRRDTGDEYPLLYGPKGLNIPIMAIEARELRGPEETSPAEPLVEIKLEEDETDTECLVDTGATYLVLNTNKHELGYDTIRIIGVAGKLKTRPFFKPIKF